MFLPPVKKKLGAIGKKIVCYNFEKNFLVIKERFGKYCLFWVGCLKTFKKHVILVSLYNKIIRSLIKHGERFSLT